MSKSLNDIKDDMSDLYEQVKTGTTELKMAAELSNIAGKYLKAEQLILAREIFESQFPKKIPEQAAIQSVERVRQRKLSKAA